MIFDFDIFLRKSNYGKNTFNNLRLSGMRAAGKKMARNVCRLRKMGHIHRGNLPPDRAENFKNGRDDCEFPQYSTDFLQRDRIAG